MITKKQALSMLRELREGQVDDRRYPKQVREAREALDWAIEMVRVYGAAKREGPQ